MSEAKGEGLAWTAREPDKAGWYWMQNKAQIRTAKPRPVQVYLDKLGRLSVCGRTLKWWRDIGGMFFLWAGPIAEPPNALEAMLEAEAEGDK